jgi:putative ABC transport system substrate-binding protein
MRRRDFINLMGGVAAAWPLAARAQQTAMPVIGFLGSDPAFLNTQRLFSALQRGLAETGYVDGRNVTIEYRWSEGNVDRFPEMAADLVRRRVSLIAAQSGIPAAVAARAATATIPIVFQGAFDPVENGLVASLNRPGGNLTGVTSIDLELGPKRLEVIHELIPAARVFALFINPNHPNAPSQLREMQAAARALDVELRTVEVRAIAEFETAFARLAQSGAEALVVGIGQPFVGRSQELGALAIQHRMPAIYTSREFVEGGGLASYSGSTTEVLYQFGRYLGRVLKGEKPADLPVVQPTKFELVVNLKTAKALGITVPITLLGRADEVIE